jgi:hypothetical protein
MSMTPTYSRRKLLTGGLAAGAALAVPALIGTAPATARPRGHVLATVDMELLLLGCQLDPPKPDTAPTPEAKDHVLAVEKALQAKGLLSADQVDGHYGTTTLDAYTAWQKSLGYEGLDANGVPGKTSLTELGKGTFDVANPVSAGDRFDSYGGKRTNTRTVQMLAAADDMLSWNITLTQGSYNTSNPGSAGTHDGGGVIDINVNDLGTTQRWELVKALRTVGFAAWLRTPDDGFAYHVHACGISDPDMSRPARNQILDYHTGRNGLANHGPDNTPEEYRVDFTWWEKYRRG